MPKHSSTKLVSPDTEPANQALKEANLTEQKKSQC
jgi:hypothetical protein